MTQTQPDTVFDFATRQTWAGQWVPVWLSVARTRLAMQV
eukprot:CAMPEP_0202844802 /NCGR_PEP_ID=MMETSP1389-20130828/68254_1 /ASSEMBLY_ACC=CAM_ASM_000865 /TAXON_ID=302021 /ORGANISM="Rhodomonas sp., Strain CCMP768" /LENGTH=38 /DNA_ID= /DNA_START= /DNA_END= /DNA_ORIENTATION=